MSEATARPQKKRRVFMWVFLAIQALFALWLIGGVSSASSEAVCTDASVREACEAGAAIGTGIGVVLILALWMIVDVILGVTYMITRRR